MNAATLTSMTSVVRARLNMTNLNTISDADIQTFLQKSLNRLYEKLVATNQDWYVKNTQLSLVANQEGYNLPSDFRSEQAVYLIFQNGTTAQQRIQLNRFTMKQFGLYSAASLASPQWPTMYRIMNNMIYFTPVPGQAYTNAVDLWYTPQWSPPASLTAAIDTNLPNGWDTWCELDTCVQIAASRRMTDFYQLYAAERKELEADVMRGAVRRDESPEYMTDAYEGDGIWGYNRPGT